MVAFCFITACSTTSVNKLPETKSANSDRNSVPEVKNNLLEAQKDGLVAVVRKDDGSITINNKRVALSKEFLKDDNGYSKLEPVELRIESLDASIPVVYYSASYLDALEDEEIIEFVFLVVDNEPIQIFLNWAGHPLKFLGDASITVKETHYDACGRANPTFEGAGDETEITTGLIRNNIWRYDSSKKQMVQNSFENTKEKFDCDELSACPYVYVENGESEVFVGEILRYLVGKRSYQLQSLPLPPTTAGTLVVRLSEEKDEKTYLDEIYVEVDGIRIDPNSCANKTATKSMYCSEDLDFYTMVKGDSRRFEFKVPKSDNVVLWARGYYNPTKK